MATVLGSKEIAVARVDTRLRAWGWLTRRMVPGGNLSAVTCLIARERGGPAIRHQALIYPATDMTRPTPAVTAPSLSGAEIARYKLFYLGPEGDPANSWASPLLAADHSGLPPALIQVGEYDPLRADGLRYAAALRAAGVPVRLPS